MSDLDITDRLRKAAEEFKLMSPEAQEAMIEQQRKSWVKGEMALGKWERSITRLTK